MISEGRLYPIAKQQLEDTQRLSRTQALRKLQMMGPELFKALVAVLFQAHGYETSVVQATPDLNVDLVATKAGWMVVVQCRPTHDVGLPAIRDLYSAMLHNQADEAYLVTTAQVTAQAREWAADKYIHLIDGWALVDWIRPPKKSSPGLLAGVRVPYVLLGALAAVAAIILTLAIVVAYPQISALLGISVGPTAAWAPPTVTNQQTAGSTPAAAAPTSGTPAPPTPVPPLGETPTPEHSPSPPLTAEPTAASVCATDVDAQLYSLYNSELLGCATTTVNTVWSAWQPFEGGYLLWRSDTDAAYAFYGSTGGRWFEIAEKWDGASLPDRGDPPAGRQAPIRGFGYVWSTSDALFQNLGWALDQEKGFCATLQRFESGFLLRSSTLESCTPNGLFNHARTEAWTPLSLAADAGGWSSEEPSG